MKAMTRKEAAQKISTKVSVGDLVEITRKDRSGATWHAGSSKVVTKDHAKITLENGATFSAITGARIA